MRNDPGDLTGPDHLAVLEALASGVSIANADGRIIYSNGAADRILGILRTDAPPEAWAGHYGVFLPDGDMPFPESEYPLVRALTGEEPEDVEMLIRRPDLAADVTIQSSARPLRDPDGAIVGAVVVFRDVTALKRARAELERSNRELVRAQRAKEELTAFVVHDLKNPISTIIALAELLDHEEELDGLQVRADARDIRAAAERMHRLVLDLLDIQLAEDGALELARRHLSVAHLFEGVCEAVRARAPGIQVGTAPEGVMVDADEALTFRLLANLVDNCVKYGPPGGRIRLDASVEPDGSVRLAVEDEGPGVPESLRDRIFEKYTQLERAGGRRASDSRGLGLRFCRVVAEAHGGTIWVEDATPRGARFCVRLPAP
jgi:signal transduction histidine kinase